MRRRKYPALRLLPLVLLACWPAEAGARQGRAPARAEGVVTVLGIPEETEALASQLTRPESVRFQGLDFVSGELRGARVVLARVGFGKVSAALVAGLISELRRLPPAAPDEPRRWKLAFELAFGSDTPYSRKFPGFDALTYEKKLAITREVLDRIVAVVLKETGARQSALEYLPGGFETFPVAPSAQLDIDADEGRVRDALDVIGYLAQQSAVIASRPKSFGSRNALRVVQTSGNELAAPDRVEAFWRRLSALAPKLNPGFSGVRAEGRPGVYIIDMEDDWLPWDFPKFEEAVAVASKEAGVTTAATHFRVTFLESANAWKESPHGEQYLGRLRLRGRAPLAARLVSVYQPRVERWIADAFRRHAPATAAVAPSTGAPTPRLHVIQPSPVRPRSRPELIPAP